MMKMAFSTPVAPLNRFRASFAGLLLVTIATSIFAGWGLVDHSNFPLGTSASPAVATSSATQAYSTTTNGASAQTTTATATASGGASTASESGSSIATTATTTSTTTVATTTTGTVVVEAVGGETTSVTTSQSQASFGALSSLSNSAAGYQGESLLREVQETSILLAPVCWVVLGGMWVWRGRVRARYSEMGFGSDVFELFMKMKGGATRIKVLSTLSTPKDRLQLAEELGIDWKAVDRHVQILNKYGFVREQAAYGTVRLYQVTPMGKMLLDLFNDLEKTDGQAAVPPSSTLSRDEGQGLS